MTQPYPRFRGPSLTLLAGIHILLVVASLVAAATLRHGAPYVTPFAPAEQIRRFFALNPAAQRVGSFFLFCSAIPFGIFAVTAVSRLRYLRVRAAGTNITLFGGVAAAIALFLSGMAGWILSLPDVFASAPVVKAVYYLCFLSGGVFYAVGFGLLAAGISITSYFTRLLPLWLSALGIAVALTGELSSLSLIAWPANFFIPITRYIGFIWMLFASVALMRAHPSPETASAESPQIGGLRNI
jgi:hypothetical protein